MPSVLSRLASLFRPRNPMPMDGREAARWSPKSGALAEVEQAVVSSNAAEVERAAERQRQREADRSGAAPE